MLSRSPVLALMVFLLLACWGGGADAPELTVEGGWARAMPLVGGEEGVGTNSAVYFFLRNEGGVGDRLVGAESPAAERVEIHESFVVGEVMRMREVEGVEVPPGGEVELKPGGLHVMLLDLIRPLLEGEEVELTLLFERSGPMGVTVPVRFSEGS